MGGGGVGGKIGITRASTKDHHAAFLEVPHGASPDEGLGYLAHFDGRLDAGFDAVLLKGVLEGQGVDNGGEHAHIIAGCSVDACAFAF